MKFYPSARRILKQMPWFQWIMIGVLEQTYPPNLFHCMAEIQSKVLTKTSAGRWEAFISLWADRQTLIWQVSLLHCECEMLDYNVHTPSFQTKTYSQVPKILKNHKDKDAGIIAKERVGEGMPWICIFDVSVGVTVFKCKKRGLQ